MTKIPTLLVGQSCRSALNAWAAQQRRPTEDMRIFPCTQISPFHSHRVPQSLQKASLAACTVFSMSAGVWAREIKPASNCDGAR